MHSQGDGAGPLPSPARNDRTPKMCVLAAHGGTQDAPYHDADSCHCQRALPCSFALHAGHVRSVRQPGSSLPSAHCPSAGVGQDRGPGPGGGWAGAHGEGSRCYEGGVSSKWTRTQHLVIQDLVVTGLNGGDFHKQRTRHKGKYALTERKHSGEPDPVRTSESMQVNSNK